MSLTIAQLRELASDHSQTTLHHCVQGFTSIGKWHGITVSDLLDLVKPLPGATDVVYLSFQNMGRDDALYEGGTYYESNPMIEARMPQTLIAFDLNDEGGDPGQEWRPRAVAHRNVHGLPQPQVAGTH
ncbi:molybdopterin-dependent oxidoreductase [Kocuria sp. cx-455]|uniref:molybdopterin-dependent oxidoreductase n=1 Tax=Kocuria sp. cx-455 TaxID=2771377 RepID=UPI003D73C7F7